MMERSSTDLPRTGTAHHAQNLAAIDIEIEMVVDHFGAEGGDQPADLDHDVLLCGIGAFCAIRSPAPRT